MRRNPEPDWALRDVSVVRLEYAGEHAITRGVISVLLVVLGALSPEVRSTDAVWYGRNDLERFATESKPSRPRVRVILGRLLATKDLPKEAADTLRSADVLLRDGRRPWSPNVSSFLGDAINAAGGEVIEALKVVPWDGAASQLVLEIAAALEDRWGLNKTPRAGLLKYAKNLADNFERANGLPLLAVWERGFVSAYGSSDLTAHESLRDLARFVVDKALALEDADIKRSDPDTYHGGLESDALRVPALKADPRKVFNRHDGAVSNHEIEWSQGVRSNGPGVLTPYGPKRLRLLARHDRRTGRFVGRGRQ